MTIKDRLLETLSTGPKTSSQLVDAAKSTRRTVNDVRRTLMRHKIIEKCGEVKTLNRGTGYEGVYCMITEKPEKKVAKNAFDWRNWEPQAGYSARELAYSYSSFTNKKESRLIVYSRA